MTDRSRSDSSSRRRGVVHDGYQGPTRRTPPPLPTHPRPATAPLTTSGSARPVPPRTPAPAPPSSNASDRDRSS